MKTLIVYDISSTKLRSKVAEILKDWGLTRIQLSAFIGELTPQERNDLAEYLKRLPLSERDKIDIFPICIKDLKLHMRIVKGSIKHGEP
ncbi:CRISPR-associated protein, Cas2 family [Staphylothermus marinus F1]|uniref:CRISPR-associated endoribonuclease Cas2 n=1 Tax=Staphylothermus marinus (strain ATCC 43588 / DSM 3639 / JCM 9404 / F1) TaxID=399550 RepID=A3DLB9_STAMF|nr:CRISPR-associated endonuclease Cas2 [Staphylothermus marinus]ABN69429.1 CRISPR-associated protein, Cas2 family [Staphylothermus marinus F1]